MSTITLSVLHFSLLAFAPCTLAVPLPFSIQLRLIFSLPPCCLSALLCPNLTTPSAAGIAAPREEKCCAWPFPGVPTCVVSLCPCAKSSSLACLFGALLHRHHRRHIPRGRTAPPSPRRGPQSSHHRLPALGQGTDLWSCVREGIGEVDPLWGKEEENWSRP